MYHEGNRGLQQQFGSTALADRLLEVTHHTSFNQHDIKFIEAAEFFFLATANAEGQPDCSFKGGPRGFVKVLNETTLVFPDYDGNGMFKSLGNIEVNPSVGLLFITMGATPQRIRVNGRAKVLRDSPLLKEFVGAQLLVQVEAEHIFPNCPRYVPDLSTQTPSEYVPKEDEAPIEPDWKAMDLFSDVVPERFEQKDED